MQTKGVEVLQYESGYLGPIQERVRLARRVDIAVERLSRDRSSDQWLVRTAREMDMALDEDSLQTFEASSKLRRQHQSELQESTGKRARKRQRRADEDDEHSSQLHASKCRQAELQQLQAQLLALLAKPLVPRGVSRLYLTANAVVPQLASGGNSLDFSQVRGFA